MTPRLLLAASLFLVAPAAYSLSPVAATPAQRLEALAEDMVEREWDYAPVLEAYYQGAGPRAGRSIYDLSPGSSERQRSFYVDVLMRHSRIPADGLNATQRDTHEMLRMHAQNGLARLEVPAREMALLTPTVGLVPGLLNLANNAQPLETEADFEAWLTRIEAMAATYRHAIALLKSSSRDGWTTPRPLVEKGLAQMQTLASLPIEQGPLWRPVARYPASAGAAKRADFELRYREALDKVHLPALRELIDFVRDDYLPVARTTAGVAALRQGDRIYRALIRHHTTTELTAEEIHALGLSEVARVRARLLEVARSLGFNGGIGEYAAWLPANTAQYPFQAPDDVLAYLRKVNDKVTAGLPRLFRRVPKAPLDIRLADPLVAASASASYLRPSADGKRPGIFLIPVTDAKRVSMAGLTSLYLHEGVPGHHLDIGLKVELDLPRYRKAFGFTVYSEGWALYAEGLGEDLGVYADRWALLGRYGGELHRAARLVVDTGMHAKGWSREQAIKYLVEERGSTPEAATRAIERYMASPGQALAYKIGELEILRLRGESRSALGEKFDLRDFHEAVLGAGPLPLSLLRKRVEGLSAR